ncbi:MAG: hypothetical protein ACI9CQ_003406, partial [Saprospiraceae bacterium]
MKTKLVTCFLLLSFFLNSTFLLAQQNKTNWNQIQFDDSAKRNIGESKEVPINLLDAKGELIVSKGNLAVAKTSSNKQFTGEIDVLKLIPNQEKNNQSEIYFDFDNPLADINFSILSFYSICRGNCNEETHQLIQVLGVDESGNHVYPEFVLSSGLKKNVSIEEGTITVYKPTQSEIGVSFSTPISRLEINSKPSTEDAGFMPYLEVGNIYSLSDLDIIPNPILPIYNCPKVNVTFAIDKSTSIDDQELKSISEGVEELLTYWTSNYTNNKLNVSILEFDSKAEIKHNVKDIDVTSLQDDSVLRDYFENGFKLRNPTKYLSWTNWESVFYKMNEASDDDGINILFFISDGAPNGNATNRKSFNESIASISKAASELKTKGYRIFGIGSDDLNNENAKRWFGYITNGKESQSINKNEL